MLSGPRWDTFVSTVGKPAVLMVAGVQAQKGGGCLTQKHPLYNIMQVEYFFHVMETHLFH